MYVCLCVRPFFNRREAPQAQTGRVAGAGNGAAGTGWKVHGSGKCLYSIKSGRNRHRLGGLLAQEMLI